MSHRCKRCGRVFAKSAHRDQHERAVHVERPRQRAAEARRLELAQDRLTFASERQAAVARGIVGRPAALLPFGGAALAGFLATAFSELAATLPAEAARELELPTIDLEPMREA